ncbi:MAG: hypothetical protein CMH13_08800 [Martelella sp.]|uniref:hypothetical protein n=1 Tax=unclassified Martelella TaxID=2629616 RepID=UPI000C411792|nr:hypothetical protein [Martelella sp.]MAU20617.1 hypothetical protein [Martelella sp.]
MKNVSASFMAALTGARENGLVVRSLVYVTARERATGVPVSLGFWTGGEDLDIDVIDGESGAIVTRTYLGDVNLDVQEIPRVSDMTIQTIDIRLSQIAPAVQQLVRGWDARLAAVEVHQLLIDPATGQAVGPAEITFLGVVDGEPVATPAAGEEGGITLNVISAAIAMLSRTNPLKSSYEGQKRRQDDQWGQYSGVVENWDIPWGRDA